MSNTRGRDEVSAACSLGLLENMELATCTHVTREVVLQKRGMGTVQSAGVPRTKLGVLSVTGMQVAYSEQTS